MNGKELIQALTEVLEDQGLSNSDFFSDSYSDEDMNAIIAAVGEFETVESGRGATGDHDSYDVVYHFKQHNVYLEANGYYSSWEGTDWSGANFYEVKPVEKTITVYEPVK